MMLVLLGLVAPAHADKITPSGPLKAYKGPEGELVAMVEISDGKEMLVYLRNTGGTADGKTLRYLFEDLGKGDKTVYINKKVGSKTHRSILADARDNAWEIYVPGKTSDALRLTFSEEATAKIKLDEVLAAYKP